MKKCSTCKELKSLELFYKNKQSKDGLDYVCKECTNRRASEWGKKNKEKRLEAVKRYRERHPERDKEITKKWRIKLRRDVLGAYSNNKFVCACCDEKEYQFLTIDHIHNNGAEERRKYSKGRSGGRWLSRLRQKNYPKGFQVLCYNCNCSKGRYGKCPHELN